MINQRYHVENLSVPEIFNFWTPRTTDSEIKLRQIYTRKY